MAVQRKATVPSSLGGGASSPASSWDVVSPGDAPWAVTLPIELAHPILRFNPYILHGYRCNLRLWHCVRSLAFLHNETCNCLTHVAALIYFTAVAWRLYNEGAYANLIQAVSVCICMALSVTYHTFMNCICCYRRLLIADVVGIWLTCLFGFSLFFLQSCLLPRSPVLKGAFILYIIVALLSLYLLIRARSALWRAVSLLCLSLIRIFCIAYSGLNNSSSSSSSSSGALPCWTFMELFVFVGAAINVLKFPERFYPGAFNYFLNSHQIMHVCSAVGLALMIRAGELDRTTGCFWNPALHV